MRMSFHLKITIKGFLWMQEAYNFSLLACSLYSNKILKDFGESLEAKIAQKNLTEIAQPRGVDSNQAY